MNSDDLKKVLRKSIKAQKQILPIDIAQSSEQLVFSEIELMKEFKNASTILAFWSLPDEINTHDFLVKWSKSKKVILPVIVGLELDLRKFETPENMEQSNSYGILEPKTGKRIDPSEIDFAIIPGIAFDIKGNRLGRGKGFYDRLLPKLSNAIKIGIGYKFQLVQVVPTAEHDIPVDKVICN
ncbi:MAG TPA: 5-formyltetrahydrofolate cyclo-ligase [Tenuifilaceae bacterium]|nr:5-formyltetrahydrofolate cyclo-ligase [Tenuifilaceae bacterium]